MSPCYRRHPITDRVANVGLWTLQVLLAAVYAFSAFGKLTAEAQNVIGSLGWPVRSRCSSRG